MTQQPRPLLVRVSLAVAIWGLAYTLYRAYYAAGGTLFLPGVPADPGQFRAINAVGAVILGFAAVLPIVLLPLWSRPKARPVLLALCWLVAVGCCMHALVDSAQRALSLAGLLSWPPPWHALQDRAVTVYAFGTAEPYGAARFDLATTAGPR